MAFKALSVFAVLASLAVFTTANEMIPAKDSFYVMDFRGFTINQMAVIIYNAEQAQLRHNGNNQMIAEEMRQKMNATYGPAFHCLANAGGAFISYQINTYDIKLKSDNGNNLEIHCFKSH